MLLFLISALLKLLFIMVGVAFVSLYERKLLGLSQNRLAPTKVSFRGILQPILDAIKLFSKENAVPILSIGPLFYSAPSLSLIVMFMIYYSIAPFPHFSSILLLSLFFMVLLGVGIYSSLVSGWASISKYASIGMVRSASQTISYEISMVLLFLPVLIWNHSFKLNSQFFILLSLPIFILWFLSVVAELNRAPFDFSEGESELISGFNIEFGSVLFTLLFLSEFGMILFFAFFTSFMFFSSEILPSFLLFSLLLLIRSVYPRFRFDRLMKLTWFIFLPISIIFLFFILGF